MTALVSEPLELTLPKVDTRSVRRHLGAALARLVRDLQRLPLRGEPTFVEDARAVLATLGPLTRGRPGLVWSALRRPSVYVHLRLAADRVPGFSDHLAVGLATLAAELGASAALEQPLVLRRPPPRLLLRSRGLAVSLSPEPLTITTSGELLQGGRACPHRRAFEPLSGSIALALEDDNPLASFEAHPDKTGSQLDLGEATVQAWTASLRDTLARLEQYLPLHRQELEVVLSELVPVGTHAEKHLSASYREALGVVYLTLHPDPLTMTEAVVHEAQHNKLNAVLTVDPLLENDPGERYPSPVRPDPRPLLGVLLAVHAFVPVALLYAAMNEAHDPVVEGTRVTDRIAQILRINGDGLALLERHARPTASGRELLSELRELHDEAARRLADRVRERIG